MSLILQNQALRLFKSSFDYTPSVFAFAPDRVNLMGSQTDESDGLVCSFAIQMGTMVAGSIAPGNVLILLPL